MIIAVTGSLGSGKSTVSKILAVAMEAEHVDTDQLCRVEMLPGRQGYARFVNVFGTRFLNVGGSLDRVLLRQAVFNDIAIKDRLEKILHPLVRQQVQDLYRQCRLLDRDMVVEVPLLFEVGWQRDFDLSVVVHLSESICLDRVKRRDGLTGEDIRKVFSQQLPISVKLQQADFSIDNSGTFASTVSQLAWLGKKLARERKMWESKTCGLKSLTALI